MSPETVIYPAITGPSQASMLCVRTDASVCMKCSNGSACLKQFGKTEGKEADTRYAGRETKENQKRHGKKPREKRINHRVKPRASILYPPLYLPATNSGMIS